MTVRWSMRPGTYDRMMRGSNQRRYYGDSGYFNFGYWGAGAKSQLEAGEALVDQMVARIANKTGRILDVACGLGGFTKRLMQTYAPEMITGINMSLNVSFRGDIVAKVTEQMLWNWNLKQSNRGACAFESMFPDRAPASI